MPHRTEYRRSDLEGTRGLADAAPIRSSVWRSLAISRQCPRRCARFRRFGTHSLFDFRVHRTWGLSLTGPA